MVKKIMSFVRSHRPFVTLLCIVLVLTTIPVLNIYVVIGDAWQGIIPTFTDELNFARVQNVGEGHLTNGSNYYLEHSDGLPLVVFGGAWLNAIPLWMGVPFNTALMLNFILWSILFAVALYWLLRQFSISPWLSVGITVFLYIQQYTHIWRPINLQPVYPFLFLFYASVLLLIRGQNRRNILFAGGMFGIMFYLFAYLWQIALITLGLLLLYAIARKNWVLAKATFSSSLIGVLIGSPVPLYMLWLSYTSPYFWESMGRLGLVNTHLPMGEVIYSGGWIGIVLLLFFILFYWVRSLWQDSGFHTQALFVTITGLALWIMQGSNLITGKQLETGEHVSRFIYPWVVLVVVVLGRILWVRRSEFPKALRFLVVIFLAALSLGSIYSLRTHFAMSSFASPGEYRELWQTQQLYAGPFSWLNENEREPVVVWSDPHDYLASVLPIFTKHFTLNTYFGMLELLSDEEVRERYLVSQYFNNPSLEDLTSDREMGLYLGRRDFPHLAKTIEREIKICRLFSFWGTEKDCGIPPTPRKLLGEQFFTDLDTKFRTDIRPGIKAYLAKYHVSYILKDKELNPAYRPQILGAEKVYEDGRFELWRI